MLLTDVLCLKVAATEDPSKPMVAIFDIDGTLVDTNYQHALSWYRALRAKRLIVPVWQIHRAIGMGSDRVVTALLGEDMEARHGDGLRDAQASHYERLIGEVEPMGELTACWRSSTRRDIRSSLPAPPRRVRSSTTSSSSMRVG